MDGADVHEMSIVSAMMNQLMTLAEQQQATRITAVELEVGRMQLVVPEALDMAWEALREGTVAAEATLTMTEVPVAANCRKCDERFEPDVDYSFMCPRCLEADIEIVSGNDIVLKSVTFETEERTDAE
ncbi:MAG: hydrogenase maturation nickel metallochaperone HypA [Phycisphaerae bacterium]|nr:hydrogenase maturation nickel metallochaperone HypA [Phycisphaerae bacterium]